MAEPDNNDRTLPRVPAVRYGGALLVWCPYCGEQHAHARSAYGHRVAHCVEAVPKLLRLRGYYLYAADESDYAVECARATALIARLSLWATLSSPTVYHCPRCQARPGEWCIQADGKHWNAHAERVLRQAQVANRGATMLKTLRAQLDAGARPDAIERITAASWLARLYGSLHPR